MTRTRKIGICPGPLASVANATIDGLVHGPNTFTVGLVPGNSSGNAPATHFVCDWDQEEADWGAVESAMPGGVLWFEQGSLSERLITGSGLARVLNNRQLKERD